MRRFWKIAFVVVATLSACRSAHAQAVGLDDGSPPQPARLDPEDELRWSNAGIDRLKMPLPRLPDMAPRPAEGKEPDQQWGASSSGKDDEPMAAFVNPVRGNDVVLSIVVGQGRLLTTRRAIAADGGTAMIAIGDPTIIDFDVLPNPRAIRVTGRRVGVTDLSITTDGGQMYNFEVHVGYDLALLELKLQQIFPEAMVRLSQLREHLIVNGQARSPAQVNQIINFLTAFLESAQVPTRVESNQSTSQQPVPIGFGARGAPDGSDEDSYEGIATGETAARPSSEAAFAPAHIINLLRVPGVHQVQLQVRVAEVNRTALREIGADILGIDTGSGNIFGTQIGGATVSGLGVAGSADILDVMSNAIGLTGLASGALGPSSTAFGIFPSGDFQVLLRLLRRNSILSILAEPNLMAMSGHEASFLAGGQFPVPVPQASGSGASTTTIQWKDFGVRLSFVPYVMDDETIRLQVAPEVSSIDFSIGTTLVVGGDPVPGVNTRKAQTTVELREGQTLAIAGLLSVALDGQTERIPGLGDLPYIGPMFSNTSHKRVEKELVVLVTPHLVAPFCEVGPLPGEDIEDPTDKEFYLLNRIEGRTGRRFRATTGWDTVKKPRVQMQFESHYGQGDVGYSR